MSFEETVNAFWDDPDNRAKVFMIGMYVTLGMMVLGYLIMIYLLFVYHG